MEKKRIFIILPWFLPIGFRVSWKKFYFVQEFLHRKNLVLINMVAANLWISLETSHLHRLAYSVASADVSKIARGAILHETGNYRRVIWWYHTPGKVAGVFWNQKWVGLLHDEERSALKEVFYFQRQNFPPRDFEDWQAQLLLEMKKLEVNCNDVTTKRDSFSCQLKALVAESEILVSGLRIVVEKAKRIISEFIGTQTLLEWYSRINVMTMQNLAWGKRKMYVSESMDVEPFFYMRSLPIVGTRIDHKLMFSWFDRFMSFLENKLR